MTCSIGLASQAEAALDKLHTWEDAINYFKEFDSCIDGGVSESFTIFMARKLADDNGVTLLFEATKQRRWFRELVAQKMQSEVISLETTESILRTLRLHCAPEGKSFCQDLHTRIKHSCAACTSDK
jgi:hypothetical protein